MENKVQILIAASIITGCLLTCPAVPAAKILVSQSDIQKTGDIYKTEEWQEIEDKWNNMDEVKVQDFQEIYDAVTEEKKEMKSIMENLITEGYFSKTTVDAINLIYGENLRSALESTVPLPCCYAPMLGPPDWDCTGVGHRAGLETRLELLEEQYELGTVETETLDIAKEDILNRLSLLDRADEYWKSKGEGNCEDHPGELDVILHLYDQNIGDIKSGKDTGMDLIKASEYIIILEVERLDIQEK